MELPSQVLSNIEKISEGWPAALKSVKLPKCNGVFRKQCPSLDATWIDRYFDEYLWITYPDNLKLLLVNTSFMEILISDACDKTLGISGSIVLLSELHGRNGFIEKSQDRVYRIHYLFRAFLRREFERLEAEKKSTLYSRYADWLKDRGYTLKALKFYLLAESFDKAEYLTQSHVFKSSEYCTVLLSSARHVAIDNPRFMLRIAWAHYATGDVTSMKLWLDRVAHWANTHKEAYNRDLTLMLSESLVKCLIPGNTLHGLTEIFKKLNKSVDKIPEPLSVITLTQNMPSIYRGVIDFSSLFALPTAESLKNLRAVLKKPLGYAYDVMEEILLAEAAYETNNISLAKEAVDRALSKCGKLSEVELRFAALCQLCRLQYASNRKNACAATLMEIMRLVDSDDAWYLKESFMDFYVRIRIMKGDLRTAVKWLKSQKLPSGRLSFNDIYKYFTAVCAYILLDKYSEAIRLAGKLTRLCEDYNRAADTAEAYILRCVAYWNIGERSLCFKDLTTALKIGNVSGFIRIFLDNYGVYDVLEELLNEKDNIYEFNIRYVKKLIHLAKTGKSSHKNIAVEANHIKLSVRQRDMLAYLSNDMSYDEICAVSHLKITTVRTHISNLYRKLDATHRREALEKARNLGFID